MNARSLGWLAFRGTIRAGSVKDDFVVFHPESRRGQSLDAFEALFEFKNPAALSAEKMMVVSLVRAFVPGRFSRNFDCYDLAVV